jgi:RNA polymerase subunit RPABC4/transcription elongation factor Spt4
MAMTNCKECKMDVSTSAKTCPHCGIKNPGLNAKSAFKGLVLLLVVSVIIATVAAIPDISLSKNLSQSETNFTGKPATTFYFGGEAENHCSVTSTHDLFKSNMGTLSNMRGNQPEFDVSCDWDGNHYVISSNHDTFAKATFYGKKDVPNTLFANIDAKLATIDGDSVSVSGSNIEVNQN